jgi:hypothetical protein
MTKLVNRAKMTTATTGTGTITLGSAESGYQSFAAAGVVDGDVVRYVIEDGTDWEIGTGTYTSSGTTLTRVVSESSSAGAAINLTGSAVVYVSAVAADFASGGGGSIDIQEFTTPGTSTWTKPSGAKMLHVVLFGGGGGGGSGARRGDAVLSAAVRGANGGGAGGRTEFWIPAQEVLGTVSVTVGAGGAGGAEITTDASSGLSGENGGISSFGTLPQALGGTRGAQGFYLSTGGTSSSTGENAGGGIGAVSPTGVVLYGRGGGSSTSNGTSGQKGIYHPGGGGGSGGFTANSTTAKAGAQGGLGGAILDVSGLANVTGGGGTAGGNTGGNGGNGADTSVYFLGGSGGGSGGCNSTASGSGGNGGYPGGGGGGGASASGSFNSGAGGNGGGGYVRVTTYS